MRKYLFILLISLGFNFTFANELFFEGFENSVVGQIPEGWVMNWTDAGLLRTVDNPVSDGIHSVRVQGQGGLCQGISKSGTFIEEDVEILFDVYIPSGNLTGQAPSYFGYAGVWVTFMATAPSTYCAIMRGDTLYDIKADQWHTFKMEFDWSCKNVKLYLDSKTIDWINYFPNNNGGWASDISLYGNNSTNTNTAYYDNIKLSSKTFNSGPELIAYYPFNSNANDESGNLNDGIVFNAVPSENMCASENSAYNFDGIDDYIQIEHELRNVKSILFWINGPLNGHSFMAIDQPGFPYFPMGRFTSALPANTVFSMAAQSNQYYYWTTNETGIVDETAWNHFALILDVDKSNYVLYLNGMNCGEANIYGNPIPVTDYSSFTLGRGASNFYAGSLDEIRFYNCSLSEAIVDSLFELNNCNNEAPVAICQSLTIDAGTACTVDVAAVQFDNGSYDPDNDPITYSVNPTGPYPLGTTNVVFTVTDDFGNFASCETSILVTGGSGDISGTILSNASPIEGVLVKLLDNSDPTLIIEETTTDEDVIYAFNSVTPDTFQVMVVEPLGYTTNINFVETILSCGNINIVDFEFSQIVTVNNARGKGYWKHQFDVYVRGKGKAQESAEDLTLYIDEVHNRYDPNFDLFIYETTFENWQNVLSVKGNAGMEAKAKSQVAALALNIMSQKIGQYEIVTEDNFTAGDVLTFVSELLVDVDSENDELAKELAEQVNEQQMIAAGLVHPSQTILYKKGIGESEGTGTSIPGSYMLYQNHPNPFNPSTTIVFDLPEASFITISVFDVQGRLISDLISKFMTAGQHKVEFNASKLSSGIYYYKMKTEGFSSVKKLILAK